MPDIRPSRSPSAVPTPTAEPMCAVVVASFRPGQVINQCLVAILAQQDVAPFAVIVVDSSTDGTAERLRREFPSVDVVALPQQTYQSQARNIGIARTHAPFVAITDQDCVVPPDWLARLLAHHQAGNYAIVGGAIGNGTPASAVGTASYLIEFNEFLPLGQLRRVAMIPYCNICIRREVFATVGPFVDVPPGAEDQVYNFLLCQHGEQLLFDPTIVVTHLNRTGFRAFLRHQHLLGVGSAIARRTVALPGQGLIRYPWLAPILPLVRTIRTSGRLLRQNRAVFFRYLRLFPILLPGYMMWAAGFMSGACQSGPTIKERYASR